MLRAVTVFCGSSFGNDSRFEEAAKALGKCLASHNIELIYGGGTSGLMGALAQSVHDHGGKVTGIIPEFFLTQNPSNLKAVGKTIVVQDMHTRKQNMLEKADAFIALPGGLGTAEELLEMITWRQLQLHNKPVGILNVAGYYDKLLEWFSHAMGQGFIKISENSTFTDDISAVSDDCEKLLLQLAEGSSSSGVKSDRI